MRLARFAAFSAFSDEARQGCDFKARWLLSPGLVDPDAPAAGYQTRMRWRDESDWVIPKERTHESLVSDELAALVAGRLVRPDKSQRKPRSSSHRYCLRGLLYCARCGTRMQGAWRPSGTDRPGRILYRCEVRRSRALPGELADHPSTLYVREDAILRHLDPWIESFADPAWLAEGQNGDRATGVRYAGLRAQLGDLDRKIANIMNAIESGGDARLLTEQLAKRNAEREGLKVRLAADTRVTALTPAQIESLVAELGGVTAVLHQATRYEKLATYDTLGLRLIYDERNQQVKATVDLSRVANRVGGGT